MEQKFTLSIFTENQIGLLHRITTIFTRRHISIVSLTTSETEVKGIYRFIIVINSTENEIHKLRKQLDKIVGVIKAFALTESEVVHQELALYKVSTASLVNGTLEKIIRDHHARVLTVEPEYMMIETTGHPYETEKLLKVLEPFGVQGFSRSGTIAISRKPLNLVAYLDGRLKKGSLYNIEPEPGKEKL
ncbi:MAG: acetolactate synthase small subunit [Bacteroidia bacterium]|nr:acetolactate synthase small subunit [Bacteroidia bacterium]